MDTRKIRVAIADDHDMLRYGMTVVLGSFSDFEFVGEARNGLEAVELCRTAAPDVLLMDLVMPEMNGVQAIGQIRQEWPNVRCIALTSFDEARLIESAIQAGAISYLIKNMSIDELADAIRKAFDGRLTIAPEAVRSLRTAASPSDQRNTLNETERAVLRELAGGRNDAEIAAQLELDSTTLEQVLRTLLLKLDAANRTEAVMIALRDGLVDVEQPN